MAQKIKRLLIANRGEIACRVIRTCREQKIQSYSLYRPDEVDLPHRLQADFSLPLGEGTLLETYLNEDLIIQLAKENQIDAIHPGYGFLSERSSFAQKVEKANILFIGPTCDSIELMGDKKASKVSLEKIKAPIVPGYHGDRQEAGFLFEQAQKIGTPLLIKASAGGGGKGMRLVHELNDFDEALSQAQSEARKSFGDDTVLLEKYIQQPRHIEVQVVGDGHGSVVHFFERECSIQRRHQKIIEEAPSPALDSKLRQEICQAAVQIASSINYRGAGTVEFIMGGDQSFYFLEMNTRLQVEHPITEAITGEDLVAWQLEVACTGKLTKQQSEITFRGHAIEARVYAENPYKDFLPATGRLEFIGQTPEGLRVDTGYWEGNNVGIDYDPMMAKVIAWASDRSSVLNRLIHGLGKLGFLGVTNNISYLQSVLAHKAFQEGNVTTHFTQDYRDDLLPPSSDDEEIAWAIAAHLFKQPNNSLTTENGQRLNAWSSLGGWRND